jgi:hypothetical protein
MRMRVETRKVLRDVAINQKKTEASLRALIDSMKRPGGIGHARRKIGDLP